MAGSTLQASKPMTIAEISARAQEFDFNPNVAMKQWLRAVDTLRREARIYEIEGNIQQTFLLLMRSAYLLTDKLPQHPSRQPDDRKALRLALKMVPALLDHLDGLKPELIARHEAWLRKVEQRKQASVAFEQGRPRLSSRPDFASSDPAVAGNTRTLGAAENSELAVKLAKLEMNRREAARRASRQAGVPAEEEQERRTAGLWDDWEAALSRNGQLPIQQDEEMRNNMEASRRRLDGAHDIVPDGVRNRLKKPPPRLFRPNQQRDGYSVYRYPSVMKPQPLRYEEPDYESRSRSKSPQRQLPPKPPKERIEEPTFASIPPQLPEKGIIEEEHTISRPNSPSTHVFTPAAYLENGNPLRSVFLPTTLREEFLAHAAPNTRKNLETCGMLCGTLIQNALFISKVVIPEQESTSDTCETINESALFDYCASEDLMVLGWIHTHPTQTCFMSSRDLHTHCGYQIMMPESIAIVCAPSKNPSWGVFRLTDPPGMQSVLNCQQTGLFHPHSENNVYTDALRPGHVSEVPMEVEVVDLRP